MRKARGAAAAIAHRGLEAAGLPGLEVPDSLAALGQLAAGWRAQFELPLIAVTGSNGKTTVTQMIATILLRLRRPVLGHSRKLQQRDRRAADLAAAARAAPASRWWSSA